MKEKQDKEKKSCKEITSKKLKPRETTGKRVRVVKHDIDGSTGTFNADFYRKSNTTITDNDAIETTDRYGTSNSDFYRKSSVATTDNEDIGIMDMNGKGNAIIRSGRNRKEYNIGCKG